ncbi:MAG TPA: c-type cytochrome [Vicinamibacteria bacterium]|nr:c-type cytochrome [Vicinamibacteria bacterium]
MRDGWIALAAGVLVIGCGTESFPEPPVELLASAAAIRDGEATYRKNCSICHGVRGHGDGPQARDLDPAPADLANLTRVRADPGYWFFRIKEGGKQEPLARPRSAMPAWGEHLSDEEIWQVVAYLKVMIEGRT